MGEKRKRQTTAQEFADADLSYSEDDSRSTSNQPLKRSRKETNTSARRSLFVRSLPATVTSSALTELFSQNYPLKHATVVLDPETKQSKGYGFVTFADTEDAKRAKEEFHGQSFQGRKLKVEIAEPRHREVKSKFGTGGKRSSLISAEAGLAKKARAEKLVEVRKPPKLIIRNLPWSINDPEKLATLFRPFGKVKYSTLPKVKNTQAGFGFVVMRGRKNAEKALVAVNGELVDGRPLAVDWAVEKDVWTKLNEEELDQQNGEGEHETAENGADEETDDPEDTNNDVENFMRNHFDDLEDEDEEEEDKNVEDGDDHDGSEDGLVETTMLDDDEGQKATKEAKFITDNSTTLFVRNLPFTTLDPELKEHFMQFGPVRYARVVMDRTTGRPKGTGFVCFFNIEDADKCFKEAPQHQPTGANAVKKGAAAAPLVKHSLLQDEGADRGGLYTLEGRLVQISRAVGRDQASKLTEDGTNFRDNRDKDKRKLYLLSEGTVASGTPLYNTLSPSEIKMREDSALQRKKLIQNNPSLHLSLTRLSIRNIPRNITSKDLKALARQAVVGFAKDVKAGIRAQLSKEEEARGGSAMREADKERKSKGKGIVKQSKIVFEGREGAKVSEDSGAGRSRGYGFLEYTSHRWALMGLRWLNGHVLENGSGKKQRLIVEFAIENAQVVERRKEKEVKARRRSQTVAEAREKGEIEEKGKKVLGRDALMARTRKGMKEGVKGKAGGKTGKGAVDTVSKGKRTRAEKRAASEGKKLERPSNSVSPGPATGDDGRLAKRQQIIARKRMMRRSRKK